MKPEAHELRQRLVEAAATLLEAAPRHELKTVNLNKALFYLDLVALRDLGETVTRATYIALEAGPVVAKYEKRLIGALDEAGLATQTNNGAAKPVRLVRPIVQHRYAAAVREQASQIAKFFAEKTAEEASNFAHKNPGWQIAWAMGLKGGKPPCKVNMRVALQQVIDEDPWLQSGASPALRAIFDSADREEGTPW